MSNTLEVLADELRICGVDEAGRGPLVGAVVAAAVVLDPNKPIEGLRDSKKLSPKKREKLAELIRRDALDWSVAEASAIEIDEINILHATMLAMTRAIEGLEQLPDLARIDGNRAPKVACDTQTIVGGDALDQAISAASILAKTVRDAQMLALHLLHPQFGFDRHKGYPTAEHREVLAKQGPCDQHRRSYAPVREAERLLATESQRRGGSKQ